MADKPDDKKARSQAQVLKDAMAIAAQRPGEFFEAIRAEVQQSSVPRQPNGKRAEFVQRFRNLSPTAGYHPNQVAALEAHRWDTVFGGPRSPDVRKCSRVRHNGTACKAPAVRGSKYCRRHGGAKAKEERLRAMFKDYRPDRAVLAMAALRQLARMNRIPNDLIRNVAEFREAYRRARFGVSRDNPLFAHMTYGERRGHHEACTVLVLAYLAAWEAIHTRQDWGPWAGCAARAAALGLDRTSAVPA